MTLLAPARTGQRQANEQEAEHSVPELPDVIGFQRVLANGAEGRTIVRVDVPDPETGP
jgi:hypothetical protein